MYVVASDTLFVANARLQVSFNATTVVHSVTTKGNPSSPYYVTRYTLSYSDDAVSWTSITDNVGNTVVYTANSDSDTAVENTLPAPIVVRYFRLNVVSWDQHISLRWGVNGCFVGERKTP